MFLQIHTELWEHILCYVNMPEFVIWRITWIGQTGCVTFLTLHIWSDTLVSEEAVLLMDTVVLSLSMNHNKNATKWNASPKKLFDCYERLHNNRLVFIP